MAKKSTDLYRNEYPTIEVLFVRPEWVLKAANLLRKDFEEDRKIKERGDGILAEFSIEKYDSILSHHPAALEIDLFL